MALDVFPFEHLTPDWGLSGDVKTDVETVQLGDGYTLRRPKGINYIKETWSPQFGFLTQDEQEQMLAWLRPRLNLVPFLWMHPTHNKYFQVVCTSLKYSATDVGIFPVQITLEQDFTPV